MQIGTILWCKQCWASFSLVGALPRICPTCDAETTWTTQPVISVTDQRFLHALRISALWDDQRFLRTLRICAFLFVFSFSIPVQAQTPTPADLVNQIQTLLDQLRTLVVPVVVPPAPTGVTIVRIAAGGNIQAALNAAANNTEIRLAPVSYSVNLTLPAGKTGITLRSDVLDSVLGTGRVSPMIVGKVAVLKPADPFSPIISTAPAASGYTILGLEIGPNTAQPDRDLVYIGSDAYTSLAQVPSNITFDRDYIHGDPVTGGHRGISFNVKNGTVSRSYISGLLEQGRDSQAIAVFNGPGPISILDNYLEASGENVLFGGADPAIANLVPSDIIVRGNTFFKPLAWKLKTGSVKNLFELKNAQRVLVENNTFENDWVDAQSGHGIVFTVRNQDGRAPWSTVRDVVFQFNVCRNFQGYFVNMLGLDDSQLSVRATNIKIVNNVAYGMGSGVQILSGPTLLEIAHNTILSRYQMLSFGGLVMPSAGFSFHDNVASGGDYGITGDGTNDIGTPSLLQFAPVPTFLGNVIEGNVDRTISYPTGNFPVAAGALATLLDAQRRYIGASVATDGKRPGADIDGLLVRIPGVVLQ